MRVNDCINIVTNSNEPNTQSAVSSVCVDPSERLMISGHEDGTCLLFDIRGNRAVQNFRLHSADIRYVKIYTYSKHFVLQFFIAVQFVFHHRHFIFYPVVMTTILCLPICKEI